MEENTARVNEMEEMEPIAEVEEDTESSGGAFIAGIAGGFLAYALIGGARKIIGIIEMKRAERKLKDRKADVVDADFTPVEDEVEDSSENTEEA